VVSVVPQPAPHAGPLDMPIPLMRRSSAHAPAPKRDPDESAVLELRTPASSRPVLRRPADEPDTVRDPDPVFALRPASIKLTPSRRSVAVMIAETNIADAHTQGAVTIPAPAEAKGPPKDDVRHTMVTTPAPRSEAPPSVKIPRSQRAPALRTMSPSMGMPLLPLPDASPILAAMDEANDRDAIIALLMSGMRSTARRVAVMAVKRDSFLGWSCNAEFGDARAWRSVQVPSSVPSVLATAAAGTPYLGPLFRTDGHEPILAFMKETSRDVAVIGVRVDMHPALVLIADELADTALTTKRLEQLAKAAGGALGRLIRKPQPGARE